MTSQAYLCKHHVDGFSAVLVHEKNIFKGLHWTSVVVELKLNCFVCEIFHHLRQTCPEPTAYLSI
ncbi:unnamed protein product [Arabidopsis arenosa]|uniref:Uncharacterized protein n=1 Tax=Arabidopsis arenosa TaxID=38785 RepID=A0A8S2B1G4_ARAAE|nr:unnamed protein product [Arabidopsis arenosa]